MNGAATIYAHSLPDHPQSQWETLETHSEAVAKLAREFASAFGAADWGQLAGQWHDLGKIQPDFQKYIRGQIASGPPHAWTGAIWAIQTFSKAAISIAFAIAGHHCGLGNLKRDASIEASGTPTPLMDLVANYKNALTILQPIWAGYALASTIPELPPHVTKAGAGMSTLEMFTRFLFSALVDADRLATSRFYSAFKPGLTADDLNYDSLENLRNTLDKYIDDLPPKGSPAVIMMRSQVLAACRLRAADPSGRFSLTVPTGGGKTLSAMSFALNHALKNSLDRVIVVIPYTSIIEQSARVYKKVLGPENVLEHHSNLDEQKLTELDSRGEQLRKLASENWDAPVVVTTTVQFFQSLLSNHPGRCRKLHNIARSVVVLDEVQTLPPQFLRTIVDVLTQLTDHFGSTVVLATATPPALATRANSQFGGLTEVREIMPDPSALARQVQRVRVEWRVDAPTPYDQLAIELRSARQVLVIVHRRDDARHLAEALGKNVLHLSAAMCPAHRLEVVKEVRRRLDTNEPCQLVSTQLVEAGVDLDFPLVYRSLAGLDSIAQSAGRCDREGRLTEVAGAPAGRLVVFRAETDPPPGVPRKAFDSMNVLIQLGKIDPFEPKDSLRFFNELYGKIDPDERRIEPLRQGLMFATVAERFRIIDDNTYPVVVPWGEGPQRLAAFRLSPSRESQRALQPFTVQVRKYRLDQLRDAGVVMPMDEFHSFDVVCEGRDKAYDKIFGLDEEANEQLPPEDSVV